MIGLSFTFDASQFPSARDQWILRAHRSAGAVSMDWFKRDRLKLRFQGGAIGSELLFARRDEKYEKNKRKSKPSAAGKAHVFSGKTRGRVLTMSKIKSATSRKRMTARTTLVLHGLGPQYRKRQRTGRIQMWRELTRLSEGEMKFMSRIYVQQWLAMMRHQTTTGSNRGRKKITHSTILADVGDS